MERKCMLHGVRVHAAQGVGPMLHGYVPPSISHDKKVHAQRWVTGLVSPT